MTSLPCFFQWEQNKIQKKIASWLVLEDGVDVCCYVDKIQKKIARCFHPPPNHFGAKARSQNSKENSKPMYALTSISSTWEVKLTKFKRKQQDVESLNVDWRLKLVYKVLQNSKENSKPNSATSMPLSFSSSALQNSKENSKRHNCTKE